MRLKRYALIDKSFYLNSYRMLKNIEFVSNLISSNTF